MKYFCFDVGNVLCDVDFTDFFQEMKYHQVESDDAWFFLNRIQCSQDLGYTQLRYELKHYFNMNAAEQSRIVDVWMETIRPNPTSIKAFEEIADRAKVAILSNIGHDHHSIIEARLGSQYRKCVHHMSCEVGARKPSRLYYKMFLDENPEFIGAVYVDDRPENLKTGTDYGFNSELFDTSTMKIDEQKNFWQRMIKILDTE